VSYTHDLSLAHDYDTISMILSDPTERQKRFKWRYRLEWREPERILHTLSKWKGGFSYWLLFQGGVEDQLRKEFQAFQKGAAHRQGLTVLQRCEQEMREKPDAPRPNSRLWKQNAMKKLAAKHEKSYKSGAFEVSIFIVTILLDIVAVDLTIQVILVFLGSVGRCSAANLWYWTGL
jgi:hypothetical protein